MGFIDEIKARAKACKKTIVLPETEDERTYKAAEAVLKEGIADLVLVGSKEEIEKNKGTYDISGAAIVDPATDARTEGYIAKLVELRQKKGMTPEQAKELLLNNYLYFMYSGVTFLPMPSSISLSLLIVAHATVVSMFPVIVADAPDLNASSPSFVSSALPAPRRMSAFGFIYLKNDTVRSISGSLICSSPSSGVPAIGISA